MSVRAYKLIEIKTADEPTFNCYHDNEILELPYDGEYGEGNGIIAYNRYTIENKLTEANLNPETKAILEQMLKDCGDEEYVEYYCY